VSEPPKVVVCIRVADTQPQYTAAGSTVVKCVVCGADCWQAPATRGIGKVACGQCAGQEISRRKRADPDLVVTAEILPETIREVAAWVRQRGRANRN
jgi:hypothetical protein